MSDPSGTHLVRARRPPAEHLGPAPGGSGPLFPCPDPERRRKGRPRTLGTRPVPWPNASNFLEHPTRSFKRESRALSLVEANCLLDQRPGLRRSALSVKDLGERHEHVP
jgi:hypothetical protein